MTDVAPDVRARTSRLLEQLRVYGAGYTQLTRRFAGYLGQHATDGRALSEILVAEDQGDPLTPARLAARIGLSSGATTNLLHRLERGGYVERVPHPTDRRSVTLRSSPGIGAPAGEFFAPLDRRLTALVTEHGPTRIDEVVTVLEQLNADFAELLDAPTLRNRPRGDRSGSGHPPE